jgi:hypothetical protein
VAWKAERDTVPHSAHGIADKFDELKANAIEIAKAAIAQKKYVKTFDKLTQPEQEKVAVAAKDVVDSQAKVLAKSPDEVFKEDIKPFEKAVNALAIWV